MKVSGALNETIRAKWPPQIDDISEREAYACISWMLADKEKKNYITQTKLGSEAQWRTILQLSKKFSVSQQ